MTEQQQEDPPKQSTLQTNSEQNPEQNPDKQDSSVASSEDAELQEEQTTQPELQHSVVLLKSKQIKIALCQSIPPKYRWTIFLFHGANAKATYKIWESVVQPLSHKTQCRVIAFNRPGYGKSTGSKFQWDNREAQAELIKLLCKKMKIEGGIVLGGRALGGRFAIEVAQLLGKKMVRACILNHPVATDERVFSYVKKNIPCIVYWAKDDKGQGQPFDGKKGASYFIQQLQCELVTFEYADFDYDLEFYQTLYCDNVKLFLSHIKKRVKQRKAQPKDNKVHLKKKVQQEQIGGGGVEGMSSEETNGGYESDEEMESLISDSLAASDRPGRQRIFVKTSHGELETVKQDPVKPNGHFVLAMHGDGRLSSWQHWEWIMDRFADEGYTIVSVSMPGYGASSGKQYSFRNNQATTDCLNQILDHYQQKQCILIGRSVGGKSSFHYAVDQPKRVKCMIVTHPVVPPHNVLNSVKVPVLMTWARNDHGGHPFAGHKGAAYIIKACSRTTIELLAWNELEYGKPGYDASNQFYRTTYCDYAFDFLKRKLRKKRMKKKKA